jgi:hypothetical protein
MRNDTNLILNRIKKVKNIEKDAELARFLGITSGLLANWKTRNTYNLDILLAKCSDISLDWLLLGKGEMLRSQSVENTGIEIQNNQSTIETQINNIRDMSEHIHSLIDTQTKYLKLLEKENERLLQENERLLQENERLQQQIANFKKTK